MKSHLLVFRSKDNFLQAVDFLKKNHPMELEAYSAGDIKDAVSFAGINTALNIVKIATLTGAMIGVVTGFLLVWFSAAVDAPLNVGGRPLNSWPATVPIMWILAVLFGGLSGFFSFLWKLSLPKPYNPIFDFQSFELHKNQFYIHVSSFLDQKLLAGLKPDEIESSGV